ncbi:MAG: four helix bundle protein [Desulfobacterales bacterium]
MALGHEKLDVYRLAIEYAAWVYEKAETLNGIHRQARDQWLRASQSIPLNIAEGNGRVSEPDRRRFFEVARGSALECAAIQDILVAGKALSTQENKAHKAELDRMAAMLSRLGKRGYQVKENPAEYGSFPLSFDFDSNFDTDSDTDTDSDSNTDTNLGGRP